MATSSTFDSLVSTLSSSERREMLERIRATIVFDEEPVERGVEPSEADVESAYLNMGMWRRLLVLLRMVFGAISKEEAIEEQLMRGLARRLRSEAAHLVDVASGQFLSDFKDELDKLKDAASFFRGPVGRIRSAGLDAFYSFVLGLESPDIRDELLVCTDPFVLSARMEDAEEPDLRREAEGRYAELMESIPAWVRNSMQTNAAFFESLNAFTDFDFSGMLAGFEPVGEEGDRRCEVGHLRAPLQELGRVLKGLATPPSAAFVEALVLFDGDLGRADQDLESVLAQRTVGMQRRLDVVRGFARRVPLFNIIRYVVGDLSYRLPKPAGGQGWRNRVRRFWSQRMESLFQLYSFERKKEDLLGQARELVGDAEVKPSAHYPARAGRRDGTHASIALLDALLRQVREGEYAAALKTLFVQGSFYKEENRAEFNEYYADLEDLLNAVATFSARIGDGGDLQASVTEAGQESDEVEFALDRVDEAAERLVHRGVETLHGLSEILRGVLYGEVGGRYDTLSNLDEVAGRGNRAFRGRLDEVLSFVKSAASVLSSMYDVEQTSARRRAALRRREP
ncbi:MAG: hypothetical protein GVY23_02640 [Spirochaetes bacterium]|jgi:hypothetical protein|nr:hypothetical protein [Spirochaetota bacterium]